MTKRLVVIALFVLFSVGIADAIPAPPSNLFAQVSGTTVILSWVAPSGALLGFRLQAGTGPGLSNVADVVIGVTTQFIASNVVPGTYYVRIRAIDATGESAPSNELIITVGGGCVPPAAPTGLAATMTGNAVTVTWQAVAGAGIVYLLEAGSASGLANLGVFNVGSALSMSASAPNGTYYVRLRASNACGSSGASSEIIISIGGLTPPPAVDWLEQVNTWRMRSGVPSVNENPIWSQGDLLHGRYSVKNDILQHDESIDNPWYTPEGRAAAMASNGAGNSAASAPDSFAIESWVQAPFHAVSMFDPKLRTVGFASYREADGGMQMSGWLDVIRGIAAGPIPPLPLAFPANGSGIPIPNRELCPPGTACFWGETPNPLTGCPGYTTPAGLPLLLQFASNTNPTVTGSSLTGNGVAIAHCVFTGGSYANPDPASQQSGRSILTARGAVVIIPRQPLPAGASYTVRLTANGQNYQWTFTIVPSDLREGPVPDWVAGAIPPSFPAVGRRR